MTERGGRVRRPDASPRRASASSPRSRRRAGSSATPSPTPTPCPFSHRSGERIEPLISLQWFMRMDELAGPRDRGRARRAGPDPPAVAVAPLPRLAGEHPPVVHLPPAVVGPPDPRLVPRRARPTSASSRPRATAGSATPTCSTRGSRSALWPFATLGWPEETPELRAFYPTDVLSTARDILFLWVARMVMMGLEFTGDIPFADVYVHSVIQAPDGRRMSKSLGTGIDPLASSRAAAPPVSRRADFPPTAPTRCASACWRCPRPRTCATPPRRSPRARRWRTSSSTPRASSLLLANADATPTRTPRRTTVEDRWILSRLRGGQGGDARRPIAGLRLPPRRARPLRLRLRRAVRLVPRADQGPRVDARAVGDAAPRAARDAARSPTR